MTVSTVIRKLPNLKDVSVANFEFRLWNMEFHFWAKPLKNGALCPECRRRGHILQTMEHRLWHDIPIGGLSIWFHYRPREIMWRQHGRVQELILWADAYARVTYRFEYAMLLYCQSMTQQTAGKILHVPKSTLSFDQLHRTINRLPEGHRIRNLKCICLDEISYPKGRKYATIVSDLDRSCVVLAGRGKGRDTIDQFFNEVLSDYQKSKILWSCCDMSATYIGAIEEHCPNAALVLDRCHIVKALYEAVDEVRKEQWREASQHDPKVLKGLR